MRDWRRDLNNAVTVWHFAHCRYNSVAHRTLELERVADHEDGLTFIGQLTREHRRFSAFERHINAEQREVALLVKVHCPVHLKHFSFAVERFYFCSSSSANHVKISHDLARPQEKATAGHQWFTGSIVGCNGDNCWLYSFDKCRKAFSLFGPNRG